MFEAIFSAALDKRGGSLKTILVMPGARQRAVIWYQR